MEDDDRHLEVTVAPMSAVTPTTLSRPDRPDGDDPRPGPRAEPEPEPAEVETGWTIRFGRIGRLDPLKVTLVIAIVAVLVLAGTLYLTRRQTADERAVSAAIAAYTAAWNAHDIEAVKAAMFPGGTFGASDNIQHESMFIASWGPDLERVLTALFAANVSLETQGRVILAGDTTRASVVQRFRYTVYGVNVVEDGISHYTLAQADRGTGLRILQHVWWRPRIPGNPSMLWIIEGRP
jgi:hypothetical protein